MTENVTNIKGDTVRETLESLLEREAKGEIIHLCVGAVLSEGSVLTSESWGRGGARPFTMLGALEYLKLCIMSKLSD